MLIAVMSASMVVTLTGTDFLRREKRVNMANEHNKEYASLDQIPQSV